MSKTGLVVVLSLFTAALQCQTPPPAAQEPAPADFPKLEAELQKAAVQALLGFARAAESDRMRSRAKTAYELIVAQYDDDNRSARTALGFKKEKGEWLPAAAGKQPKWDDTGAASQRARVETAWKQTARKLAAMHRDIGLQLVASDELSRGYQHLEKAVAFDPDDAEAHTALGHKSYKGFFGTEAQVAFLERLAAIEDKAHELANLDSSPEVVPVSALPNELARTGLTFTGARSAHMTIWSTAPQEETLAVAQWGERAVVMLEFLLGNSAATYHVGTGIRSLRWIGLLHSNSERDLFIENNKEAFGKMDLSIVRTFAGWVTNVSGGRAHVSWGMHEQDFDKIVAYVTEYGFSRYANDGFGEGLVHAMTYYLLGTTYTWFGSVPSTVSQYTAPLEHNPDAWLDMLREQIDKHTDWPLQQIPRERLESFRPDVRIKTWSFMVWAVARYPQKWAHLLHAFDQQKGMTPEQTTSIIEAELGATLPEIEAEWRDWLSGKSALAKASGHGR